MDWDDVGECEYCGSHDQSLYIETDVPNWYAKQPMRLVECGNCRLVFANPRPDRYQLNKNWLIGHEVAQKAFHRKRERKNVMDIHTKHVQRAIDAHGNDPKSLFDMGCGAGTVMEAARSLGLEAAGNDINKYAMEQLAEMGFSTYFGFTDEIDLDDKFDIVINFDYLEHTFSPWADLQMCFDMLNPGGVLYLKTLYLNCPDHVEKGEHWQLFGNGHHYFFYNDMLRDMVERAGFELVEVRDPQLIFIMARRPVAA